MKSIHEDQLKALYQRVTRGLPNDADRRITADELVRLARGEHLGERHADVLAGLAVSSDQALVLNVLMRNRGPADELARDAGRLRLNGVLSRLQAWWRSAGMPPAFAAAGISLMAVIGFQFLGSGAGHLPMPQTAQSPSHEAPLFDGEFEPDDTLFAASLETGERGDALFNGNFDS